MCSVEVIAVMGEGTIEYTPTPIVRCRDCAHFRENLKFGDSYTWCAESAVSGRLVPPDGYCWRGERREA